MKHKNQTNLDSGGEPKKRPTQDTALGKTDEACKRAKEGLRESEEKFRLLSEQSLLAIGIIQDGLFKFVNQAYCDISGYSIDEIRTWKPYEFSKVVHPDDRKFVTDQINKKQSGDPGALIRYQFKGLNKNNEIRWLELYSKTVSYGKKPADLVTFIDITERMRAAEALSAKEELYRAIFENTGTATVLIEKDTIISLANREFECLSGYSKQEIEGKMKWTEFVAEEDLEIMRVRHQLRRIHEKDIPNHYEFHFLDRHKNIHDIYLTAELIPGTKKTIASLLDITENKKAEAALRTAQEQTSLIFNSSMDAILLTAPDGSIFAANPAARRMFGRTEEEICSLGRSGIVDSSDPRLAAALEERARTGSYRGELTGLHKDGSKFPIEISSAVFLDKEGRKRTSIVIRDLTEHKRAEEALCASEMLFSTVFNSSPIAIAITRMSDSRFLNVNEAWERITGYSRSDALGHNAIELGLFASQTDRDKLESLLASPGPSHDMEINLKKKSGEWASFLMTAEGIKAEDEMCLLTMAIDITERKRTEDALKEREEFLSSVVENIPDMIFIKDAEELRFVRFNRAGENLLGYKRDDLIGKNDYDFFPKEQADFFINKDKDVLSSGRQVDIPEEPLDTKTGRRILHTKKIPICDKRGRPIYLLGISEDITERKQSEERLNQSFMRLRESLGATIQAMAMTVEARDPYTAGHQRRVSDLGRAIATEMNLDADKIEGVRMASAIHDIGKISVPAEILSKPSKLSPLEYQLIKIHPQAGYDILKDIDFPWPIARIILEHHERVNGSGYPNGLTGESLLMESKILSVADTVEAIASHRPYRPSLGVDEALKEIHRQRGILFDPDVVRACLKIFHEKGYKLPD